MMIPLNGSGVIGVDKQTNTHTDTAENNTSLTMLHCTGGNDVKARLRKASSSNVKASSFKAEGKAKKFAKT